MVGFNIHEDKEVCAALQNAFDEARSQAAKITLLLKDSVGITAFELWQEAARYLNARTQKRESADETTFGDRMAGFKVKLDKAAIAYRREIEPYCKEGHLSPGSQLKLEAPLAARAVALTGVVEKTELDYVRLSKDDPNLILSYAKAMHGKLPELGA